MLVVPAVRRLCVGRTRVKTLVALLLGLATLGAPAAAADVPPLNAPATTESHPGKFIWGDLFTADPQAAETFYTGLFGWKAATISRSTKSGVHLYVVLSVGDRPVAGIARRPARLEEEVHGRWVGYVSVPDVGQALGLATSAGGRVVLPARDVAQRGTQAVFRDPDGALLGVMHSTSGDPGEYLPEPGDWTWAEVFARDTAAAGRFYGGVLGYDVLPDNRTDKPGNLVLVSGGYSRAAVSPVPNRPKAHPVWLLFVRVANVKETVARAVALGGRVLVAPSDTPTNYWRAVLADPAGTPIGVVQLEDAPPPPTPEAR